MQFVRTTVLCVGLLFLGQGMAQAQDARLAQQALQCAVLMDTLAHADVGAPDQAPRWQRAGSALQDVHRKTLGGAAPDARAREQMLAQLQAAHAQRSAALQEDVVVCGAWAEGFLAQGAQVQYVPVYPKVIAPALRSQYAEVARAWLAPR